MNANMNKQTKTLKNRGVTLIEMLVAMAILVITTTFVIPNFQRMVFSNRVAAASNELSSMLKFGQMEAIRTRNRVVACASQDGTTCSGTNWGQGIVFVDTDRDGTRGSSEKILRSINTLGSEIIISQNKSGTISFSGIGLIHTSGNTSSPFEIAICSKKGSEKKSVLTLNGAGIQQTSKRGRCE